jgi:macrodomain Ter protein organizer (MatP/YcbG family)
MDWLDTTLNLLKQKYLMKKFKVLIKEYVTQYKEVELTEKQFKQLMKQHENDPNGVWPADFTKEQPTIIKRDIFMKEWSLYPTESDKIILRHESP